VLAQAQQAYATATQAVQTVAAVRSSAQDLGQLATHGLPTGADVLATGAKLAELGSAVPKAITAPTDKLPIHPKTFR
jgi:hypothetical protein